MMACMKNYYEDTSAVEVIKEVPGDESEDFLNYFD